MRFPRSVIYITLNFYLKMMKNDSQKNETDKQEEYGKVNVSHNSPFIFSREILFSAKNMRHTSFISCLKLQQVCVLMS